MPNYRRLYLPSQAVFITSTTFRRKHIFSIPQNVDILLYTIQNVQHIHPFEMLAYVIMPDHVHLLIQTPDDTPNYSPVIHSIKRNYSFCYKQLHHIDRPIQIWQERFFDHVIRDDTDFDNHLDYIHYNPVKH
jgi:putative transposase